MDAISLVSRVRITDDVVFRDLEGELVLLNLKTGVYFSLDPVGTRIWHLVQERACLRDVLDSLLDEYEVDERRCADDLVRLVDRMREQGLVDVADPATA